MSGSDLLDEDFLPWVEHTFSAYQEVIILEDDNARFGAGRGPVGIVGAITNGYLFEPHVEWFEWATPRNKLRAAVAFFQKYRWKGLGVIRVHTLKESTPFFRRLKKYVPLFPVGRIPGGDSLGRGDDNIFYMKCRSAK